MDKTWDSRSDNDCDGPGISDEEGKTKHSSEGLVASKPM
jgi:hypothetical protein